ncbi:MAG: hypothetical protein EXR79_14845 [Myxococcales bacterium]|nr:hypothetical protein [Myxococcales bacterium]
MPGTGNDVFGSVCKVKSVTQAGDETVVTTDRAQLQDAVLGRAPPADGAPQAPTFTCPIQPLAA